MNQDERAKRTEELAGEVLTLSRSTLLVNLRFLDTVLSQIPLAVRADSTMETDGQTMYYGPRHVLRAYQEERTAPVRDYLHLVLHCIFRHMYAQPPAGRAVWDLACDIAVEHTISGLDLPVLSVKKEARQRKTFARLREEAGVMTAEKIYRALLKRPAEELETLRPLFLADSHRLWYAEGRDQAQAEAAWKNLSRRMQVDMETFAKRQGEKAGALMQNLREANRQTWDYTGFLQKFAARGEGMKLDPDEFDYIFYTYGMRLYERVPLIEPLEYKEVKRVREFAVALGMSEGFPGELTRAFLRETLSALQAAGSFRTKIHLHILTGGTPEGESVRITSRAELEEYLERAAFPGADGGDFRPMFRRMDDMVRRGAFENLRGLLYFTDGYGAFPSKKPAYETAFVFVNDDYSVPDVPSWAIRMVLQREELEKGEET